ncbi:MAG: methyltransferase domain-containing protein [Chloroflexaceae bacterium]|nr:methyltransferase domain-containing protein [Chloroflexaceae bacterium]
MSVPLQRQTVRHVEQQRLVYYRQSADVTYWQQHWQQRVKLPTPDQTAAVLRDFNGVFQRWLPHEGRILEAGCGNGRILITLRYLGYPIEGVEWVVDTVRATRASYPDLPIRVADVTRLDVLDTAFDAYISLGVVEHRRAGPEPFLTEAYRVLRPAGIMLISVPYFNPLRRFKVLFGSYRTNPAGLEFYQYAFRPAEFNALLQQSGFQMLEHVPISSLKGLREELSVVRWMASKPRLRGPLNALLERWQWSKQVAGHMMLYVCRKTE